MSAFLTPLENRRINGSRQRELLSPLLFQSDEFGIITAPEGFIYNGPSSPVIAGFGSDGERPSAIHDFMYANPKIYTRAQADAVLREALEVDGFGWIRRQGWWLAVRMFGGTHYGKERDENDSPDNGPGA